MRSTLLRNAVVVVLSIGAAGVLWSFALAALLRRSPAEREELRRGLLSRQVAPWQGAHAVPPDLVVLRENNPEWDFMSRTFLVLTLANLDVGADAQAHAQHLATVDAIVLDTLALEQRHGQPHFLMSYWQRAPFRDPSQRSLFVDGEIALMLAIRARMSGAPPGDPLRDELARRVQIIDAQMSAGPVVSGESYPDECWTFCNATALAALRVSDSVTGEDHGALAARWLAVARARLVDEETGILVSSYTYDGVPLDGPEGSSIFWVAHMLELVDPVFARQQYEAARRELAVEPLGAGFAFAREWPGSGHADVDSGPIVPLLEASAGASGLAIVSAHAFGDEEYANALLASLSLAAFPTEYQDGVGFAAGNRVGDTVVLYAMSLGPFFSELGPGGRAPASQISGRAS